MILYNLTIKVEWPYRDELISFLRQHLGEVAISEGGGLFALQGVDTTEGPTYCMQLKFPDMGTYNQHMIVSDAKMKQDLHKNFGDKVVFFGSILQSI